MCPAAGGLGATEETSPEQVGRGCACRGMSLHSQAASVTDVCLGWHQSVAECLPVCVSILYMCCPSSHSSSDSTSNYMRKMVAGKSNKRDLEDNRAVWKSCLVSALDKNISTGILYLLSVELYYWEILLSQSVSWIAYSCFLFWALWCTSVSQSAPSAVSPVL